MCSLYFAISDFPIVLPFFQHCWDAPNVTIPNRRYTRLEDLAKSDAINAVYIASPTSEHAKQAIMMLEHGKHVLCEKPACSNAKELEAVLAAAKASGCVRSLFDRDKTP
jgi:predicted dehydrogenase